MRSLSCRKRSARFGLETKTLHPGMGNTIAIKLHTHHGDEVICDHRAHILDWELGMPAWFSGAILRTLPTDDGISLYYRDITARKQAEDRRDQAVSQLQQIFYTGSDSIVCVDRHWNCTFANRAAGVCSLSL